MGHWTYDLACDRCDYAEEVGMVWVNDYVIKGVPSRGHLRRVVERAPAEAKP
jgi:hypothetical protein